MAPPDTVSTPDHHLLDLALLFTEVGEQLHGLERVEDTLEAVTDAAIRRVDGAESASVTRVQGGGFETIAATGELATRADRLQYELRSGPCVDAIVDHVLYRVGDLGSDARWPVFGPRAAAELGVVSMLSFRLAVGVDGVIGGLNLYSTKGDAFDDESEGVGTVLATHAALAVTAASTREAVANLQRALESNREIGTAMGVLMARLKVPRDQAFGLLRMASQSSNRKLRDIATEVVDTGILDLPTLAARAKPPRTTRDQAAHRDQGY